MSSQLIASSATLSKVKPRQLTAEEVAEIEHELTLYPDKRAVGLEALKIVQKHQGWVSDESLLGISRYLGISAAELEGVATFFNLIYRKPVGRHVILFCDSVSCWIMGCEKIHQHITQQLAIDYGETTADGAFTLIPVPCLGDCDRAPVMMVGPDLHRNLTADKIDQIIRDYRQAAGGRKIMTVVVKPLTRNIDMNGPPPDLGRYQSAGGYASMRKIAAGLSPADVLQLVKDSGLKGRGGAGFPTGLKWSFVPMGDSAPQQKYLVVNADEMEPGTFKDRLLMEGDPHLLIEGMLIAAYTIQASKAYIFLRGEYTAAEKILQRALQEARHAGLLGSNILNTGFDLDIILHTSAGRYICGEETALLNALEGKRANPRAKPPFPQVSGLWGKPTIVNNVETLCNLPGIISYGVEWYHSLTRGSDHGTKLFGVSGRVKNPGCWELPLGTLIREVIEEYAGGMQDGYQLKAFLPGGGSTDFMLPEHLDLTLDYDVIGKAGSRLATGTMILLDDRTCPVGMVGNLMKFFSHESCGFCTPCRDGLPWIDQIFQDLEAGKARQEDIQVLHDHIGYMGPGRTFCALAPGATAPLGSGLKYFKEDFERHLHSNGCPYHAH